jgi:hypothetical protein
MEWVEWLLSREFRQFLFDNNLFFPLLFVVRLLGLTTLENFFPARKVPYRSVLVSTSLDGQFLCTSRLQLQAI